MLIYDRTQTDVNNAKLTRQRIINNTATADDLAAWRSGMKGALNSGDFTRIETEMRSMALAAAADGVTIQHTNQTWSLGEWPNAAKMNTYFNNARNIKNAMLGTNYPMPERVDSYTQQNEFEYMLQAAKTAIANFSGGIEYCGDAYCGG